MAQKTGKINRTPSEPGLDLPLDDLIWLREEWLSNVQVAPNTRTDYAQKTRHFVDWWTHYGETASWRLTQRHLLKFEEYLLNKQSSRGSKALVWHTRNNAIRRTAELLGWAYRNGYIEGVSPRGWMPLASGETPERTAPTVEQLGQLMRATDGSWYPLRDQTILAMFIGTGMRLSELATLRAENIVICDDQSGTAAIVGKRTKANRSGRRTVAFDASTGRHLAAYLDAMMMTEGPLFLNDHSGMPLKSNTIYKAVKRAIAVAGLEEQIQGCHDLRRAFATILSQLHPDSPLWADMIRRQLGHKHYSQTAAYNKMSPEHIRSMIVSPLAPDPAGGVIK